MAGSLDRLYLSTGDIVTVITKHTNGWWFLRNGKGATGWAPASSLQKMVENAKDLQITDSSYPIKARTYFHLEETVNIESIQIQLPNSSSGNYMWVYTSGPPLHFFHSLLTQYF